jgi:hypothetical protein
VSLHSLTNELFKEQEFAAKPHSAVPGIVPFHSGLFNLENGCHLGNDELTAQIMQMVL